MNKYLLIELVVFVLALALLIYENYFRGDEYDPVGFSTLLFISVVPPFNVVIVLIEVLALMLMTLMPILYVINLIRGRF